MEKVKQNKYFCLGNKTITKLEECSNILGMNQTLITKIAIAKFHSELKNDFDLNKNLGVLK